MMVENRLRGLSKLPNAYVPLWVLVSGQLKWQLASTTPPAGEFEFESATLPPKCRRIHLRYHDQGKDPMP